MEAPEGLRYVETFLSENEQEGLLGFLRTFPPDQWQWIRFRGNVARRKKMSFGWNYELGNRRVTAAPPFPDSIATLRDRCAKELQLPAELLVQATVTFYPPGSGIGVHKDASLFGDLIC